MAAEPVARLRHVLAVVGTRPEAIKLAPVVAAIAARPGLTISLLLTGQHKGLEGHFPGRDIAAFTLDLREHSVGELRERLHFAVSAHLARHRPDLVMVQGDTTSALAGALAAHELRIPIAHVEAGLRSHDYAQPYPEEDNRVAIDAMADLLFAPTMVAAANLAAEPAVRGTVSVTGNSGIDALLEAAARVAPPPSSGKERRIILVTSHRRENGGPALASICTALKRLVAELPVEIVFALHDNPHRRAAFSAALGGVEGVRLTDALPYEDMVREMMGAWIILTDSGGLQEEGPALGRPVLVMRGVTERVEAPANVELVGTDPDEIVAAVHRLLMNEIRYARMAQPALPFGDGQAAPRIAVAVERFLGLEPAYCSSASSSRNSA